MGHASLARTRTRLEVRGLRGSRGPLFTKLGPAPSLEDARDAIKLAVAFWNANVLASKLWEFPRGKELNALKTRMRGRQASREDAALFDELVARWREHWLDPRLVESWTYGPDAIGDRRLVCVMGLPDGVRAEVPPPAEKRVAIGGKFLDEVRISQGRNASLIFPVDRHRGVVAADGTATVHAMMPSALQLFAEGLLPPVGSGEVELVVGGRALGPMVLASIGCGGENYRNDMAILVFRPASASSSG